MRKLIFMLIIVFSVACPWTVTFGATVFTAPIDSRPVSTDYLGRLAEIAGDGFVCVDKDKLDFFSGKADKDHIGDSKAVREQIYDLAGKNNSSDSTFIINMTSYVTGGLVGSRSGENYGGLKDSLKDLEKLLRDYPQPKYYINLSMPRTLPDSRFGPVWSDSRIYEGLGSFYLKRNPDSPQKSEIASKYSHVSAPQLLLEWSYVKNHEAMGELSDWERDFLDNFRKKFETKDPYRQYLYNYRRPYLRIAELGSGIMALHKKGLDFELVLSVDDLSLPDFIVYMNDESLSGDRIKYSFALNYMENSLYGQAKDAYGVTELEKALTGRGDKINFIFGTDEVPQLIYARDLSKRTGIIPAVNKKNLNDTDRVADFDVKNPAELVTNALNFVSGGKRRAVLATNLYVFNYAEDKNFSRCISSMEEDCKNGFDVALIELYTPSQTANGENYLFKNLWKKSLDGDDFGIHSLAAYSAWNTSANAIGLGVANAAVASICKERENTSEFQEARLKMLITHAIEDGVYNCDSKRQLYGYYPYYDENNRDKLRGLLEESNFSKVFSHREYKTDDGVFKTGDVSLTDCFYPWDRTFECYIEVNVK